jgi:diacylglycerol kinase (ATP)
MKERKLLFLINPISGTSKKEVLIKLIEKETTANGFYFEIDYTNAKANYDYIIDKIEAGKFTDIIIVGGDGTVNSVINSLRFCKVNFGIIAVGSGNGLARAAHIPMKAKAALALIFEGKASYIDAFMVNNHFACMLSGLGFDAQVAHDFSLKTGRGLINYTQQSIANYFKAQPYQFEVAIDNFTFFTDAFFISIANSNQFGNNITIAPKAKLNDGLLDIVIVQKMSKAKLPFALLQQIRGNNKWVDFENKLTQNNILYFQSAHIAIKNIMFAPLHIDGDPIATAKEFDIKILENCIQLIH